MEPTSLGPLFVPPWEQTGLGWMHWLPIVLAGCAVAVAGLALLRGRLSPPVAALGLVGLPLAGYGLGVMLLLEDSKRLEFCGSCHLMEPLLASVTGNDDSLASRHFALGAVPADRACYVCHSGYGIWGTVDAKEAGLGHMIRTVTGRYDLPIHLSGKFDIDSCLGCHAAAARFRGVEAHQPLEVQEGLLSGDLTCTGMCHPAAHPDSALTGGRAAR